ncbi:flagellar basal-body rod protein FlgB [Nitrosococcus halophilus Nc 4]|uniref:Flagellar basal body rod protein FlgB n=1 Tax=Nitrosococcus halophilus (strain Nc4) TaxID=472759 RepID=D5BV62_NITHN|nr:flagellar basal body rod protein FlgB [Nitrosococcus halophilus]ADE15412.1 flagellar basal-body rod protein FlgB [Nitrosococcus halophilus Nc 4]
MSISFDSALGIHPYALSLWSRRAELLAANLANADTPGYKARDIDFKTALQQAQGQGAALPLQVTHGRHLPSAAGHPPGGEALYRLPLQASIDGNTVDSQVEHGKFMQNALQYQASLHFLSGSFKGLQSALKGE